MLIGEHSSDFLNYLSYLSHCDRGKELFKIHAWMLKTLLSEADQHPFLHYIIATSYGKMICQMQNPNSIIYYYCLQNQKPSSLTFNAPSKEWKKSQDKSLIKTIISLAKSEDLINDIPNLQHVAVEAIEIYNESTYIEFHLLLCELLFWFKDSLERLCDLKGKSPTVEEILEHFIRVWVMGCYLKTMAISAAIETHLQSISNSLIVDINKSWMPPKPKEVDDTDFVDFQHFKPFSKANQYYLGSHIEIG